MGPYKAVPQAISVPVPMQSYNPPLKSGYSTDRTDYFGYDSAQVPLTGTHPRLLLREDDLVSTEPKLSSIQLTNLQRISK